MKTLAVKFYNESYNCSQCIIKAFEEKYGYDIENSFYNSLSAVNTGFGVGSVCSALVAGIIIFGLVFDERTSHRARLKLLAGFDAYFNSINCSGLDGIKDSSNGCERIISMAAYFIEKILIDEGFHK